MSNMFKTNSRFSGLFEDTPIYREKNDKRVNEERINSFKERRHDNGSRELNEKNNTDLNIENFPELTCNIKKNNINLNQTYIEKLKSIRKENDTNYDPDLANLKPGHILFKKDKNTGKIIILDKSKAKKERNLTDKELIENAINSFSKLYEKRTQEFIHLNGYDTWEYMFKFPDWRERELELDDDPDDVSDVSDDEYGDEDDYDTIDY